METNIHACSGLLGTTDKARCFTNGWKQIKQFSTYLKGRRLDRVELFIIIFFDNGSEYESECRLAWVDAWVDTSVGVRKRQPEISGADLQPANYCNSKIDLKAQCFIKPF